MKGQRSLLKMKEKQQKLKKKKKKPERSRDNSPDTELKTLVIRTLTELGERLNESSEDFKKEL